MFNFNELQNLSDKKLEEQPATKVVIELFRHSLKENDPNRPNSELLLTPEGRGYLSRCYCGQRNA